MQLTLLQSFIKKAPETYAEEFKSQFRYFRNELEILSLSPSRESPRLLELLDFITQTVAHYSEDVVVYMDVLFDLVENKTESLHPATRFKVFQSLTIVHRQVENDSSNILKLSFTLLSVQDKMFRAYVTEFILTEIKRIQTKKQNNNGKNAIQSFIHSVIGDPTSPIAYRCVEILSRLYRKKIWTDSRTVNILALACLSPESKVHHAAINFFLGIETALAMDEEEEAKDNSKMEVNNFEHSKKTKKRARLIEKQKAQLAKKLNAKSSDEKKEGSQPLYPAIMVINDPHSLAEHVFKKLKQSSERFEQKLVLMNFVSQLIGCHRLLLLNFYSFVQKYLTSHNSNVTNILTYLVQAVHDMVPPSELLPVIKTVANNFISDRSSEESITVGLNCIREVIARLPSLLLEDDMDGFVQDLAQYSYKNKKYVMAASRGLVNLVREHHPQLLRKSDRGRFTDKSKTPTAYGVTKDKSIADMVSDSDEDADDSDEENSEEDEDEGEWEEVEDSDAESDGEGEDEMEEDGENESSGDEAEEEEEEEEEEEDADVEVSDRHSRKRARKSMVRFAEKSEEGEEEEEEEEEGDDDENGSESSEGEEEEEDYSPEYRLDPSLLLPQGRMHKASKIERLKQILSGRVEKRFQHEGHAGGLTNKEKARQKNYVMVRRGKRSVVQKKRSSVQERRWRNKDKVCLCFLVHFPCISTFLIPSPVFIYRKSSMAETSGSGEEFSALCLGLCRLWCGGGGWVA